MGVALGGEKIRLTLAQADQKAKNLGLDLQAGPVGERWNQHVQTLRAPSVPTTYTAVLAVTLVARAIHDSSVLSVRDIQKKTGEKGYSASSIGSELARFAKTHNIDLRATSQQPLNNQPFTYKERILSSPSEMNVADRARSAWAAFNRAIDQVESATPSEAADALALLFHLSRKSTWESRPVGAVLAAESLEEVGALLDGIAGFVDTHSDNGKTGQAFAAAVLDILYGSASVRLGKINDPDASTVGDVHVLNEDSIWLWTEVKQKVITAGDVNSFVGKVAEHGGSRAIFCAFLNNSYPDHVQRNKVNAFAHKKGVMLDYFDMSADFVNRYFRLAPGSTSEAAARLVVAMISRMSEALCPQTTLDAFEGMIIEHGVGLN